jgi:hypothetical protein
MAASAEARRTTGDVLRYHSVAAESANVVALTPKARMDHRSIGRCRVFHGTFL